MKKITFSIPILSCLLFRLTYNAWEFDAIFTVTPQFYASGITNATITFTISAGPAVACG